MRLMAVEYVEKVQVQLKNVSKRPRRDSDEAVMHLPHRPATDNHGQPHNKGLDSTADTYVRIHFLCCTAWDGTYSLDSS